MTAAPSLAPLDSETGPQAASSSTEPIRFGVVIPVHNEEQLAPSALESLDRAIDSVIETAATVGVAIVLDACDDRSKDVVTDWRCRSLGDHTDRFITVLETDSGNVGLARRMGCEALLDQWSADFPERIWLATTDADSEVPPEWITAQLRVRRNLGQLWVGAVHVHDWSSRAPGTEEAWRHHYRSEQLSVHGANLGIDAATYLAAGGFEGLSTGEDRALVERAVMLGAVIGHDPSVQVVTSARREARAPLGFAHALTSIEVMLAGPPRANRSRPVEPRLTALAGSPR